MTPTERERFEAMRAALIRARNAILFAAGRSDHKGTCLSLQQEVAKIDVALASRAADVPEPTSPDEQYDAQLERDIQDFPPTYRRLARDLACNYHNQGYNDRVDEVAGAAARLPADVPERVSEPTWSSYKDAPESHARICKLVNECSITQSALYDINLLPEQTGHDPIRWAYTIAVAEHIALAKARAAPPAITTPETP